MLALRLRQATAGVLVIGILLAVLGFCALIQVVFSTIRTKGLVKNMMDKERITAPSPKTDYWKDKNWNDTNGLLWFVQVTDLHLSKFRDPERAQDFQKFCFHLKNVIKPQIVMATGDLTDAKTVDHIGSQQFEEEWKTYNSLLKNCGILDVKDVKWLDLRGNHDAFNLEDDDDPNNFFLKYSVQGALGHRRSYSHFVKPKKSGPSFGFVGIDFTLTPSPKRPFNFFGVLSDHDMYEVEEMLEKASKPEHSQGGLITFGHYPLSTVLTPGRGGISAVIGRVGALAYLSGHIHSLLGLAPEIYTKQSDGYLDLELTDWKDSRQYRIGALDRGTLSFTDQPFVNTKDKNKNAVLLITNPLDARFVFGNNIETTLKAMKDSTHIRILVFGSGVVKSVKAVINDEPEIECHNVMESNKETTSPLYVASWSPKELPSGKKHNMKVTAVLSEGSLETTITTNRQFVLDTEGMANEGLEEEFRFFSRAILMSNLSKVLQVLFSLSIAGLVLPLCLLRLVHRLTVDGQISKPVSPLLSDSEEESPKKNRVVVRPCNCFTVCLRKWLRRFWLLANINHLCYPLVGYVIYVAVGPWAVGYLIGDNIGAIFSWGMYIKGSFLPTHTTLLHGVFFIMPYIYALMVGVAWNIDRRFENFRNNTSDTPTSFCRYVWRHSWFVILMLLQTLHCVEFYLAYGLMAFFSIPGAMRLFFSFYMWIQATSIKIEDVPRDIFRVWSAKSEKSCS